MDRAIRYSMLDTSYRCLRKYQYQYLDGLKSDADSSGEVRFGTGLHAGLNAILEGDNGQEVFNLFWESAATDRTLRFGAHGPAELQELANVFLERFERLHVKKFQAISMEKTLHASLGPLSLEGTADFIGNFDNVPSVVDFKTSRNPYEKAKILHNSQLYLYAYLARRQLRYKPIQLVYMVFVKHPEPRIQVVKVPLTGAAYRNHLNAIREQGELLLQSELSGKFPKNCTGCMMGKYACNFFEKCWGQDHDSL